MNTPTRYAVVIGLATLGAAGSARADLIRSGQSWIGYFVDDGTTLIETEAGHGLWFETRGRNPADTLHASLSILGGFERLELSGASGLWIYNDPFTPFSELTTAYPDGVCHFALTGGGFDGLQASYEIPASLLQPFVPARLSASTRSLLDSGFDWRSGEDLTITVDGPVGDDLHTNLLLTLAGIGGSYSTYFAVDPSTNSVLIPSELITGWDHLDLSLVTARGARAAWTGSSVDTEDAYLGYSAYINSGSFDLVPAPSALGVLVLVAAPMARRRRR